MFYLIIPDTISDAETMYLRVSSSRFKLEFPLPEIKMVGVIIPPITAKKSVYYSLDKILIVLF